MRRYPAARRTRHLRKSRAGEYGTAQPRVAGSSRDSENDPARKGQRLFKSVSSPPRPTVAWTAAETQRPASLPPSPSLLPPGPVVVGTHSAARPAPRGSLATHHHHRRRRRAGPVTQHSAAARDQQRAGAAQPQGRGPARRGRGEGGPRPGQLPASGYRCAGTASPPASAPALAFCSK